MPITDIIALQDSSMSGPLPNLWSGTEAVDGTADAWLLAPLGSIYVRFDAGNVAAYMKTTADNDNGDWQPLTLGTALT